MRFTEEQLRTAGVRVAPIPTEKPQRQGFGKFRQRGGRGRRRKPGEMNGTERKYADRLDSLLRDGVILWYGFEATTFKLAPDTRYTPDFTVMLADLTIEFHEVKGSYRQKSTGERKPFIEEDAKLKIKIAAELLPFRFSIVYPIPGGQWGRKDFWEPEDAAQPTNGDGLFHERMVHA